jgi:hypothetical protein
MPVLSAVRLLLVSVLVPVVCAYAVAAAVFVLDLLWTRWREPGTKNRAPRGESRR